MLATQTSIEDAYALAVAAKIKRQRFIVVEVPPKPGFTQFNVRLWNACIGKVIGRRGSTDETPNGERINRIDCLYVRVEATSVIEAMRVVAERRLREQREGPKTMRVNRVAVRPRVSTTR